MNRLTGVLGAGALLLSAAGVPAAWAQQPQQKQDTDAVSMDQLLREVREGRRQDAAESARREAEFLEEQARQDALIRDAERQVAELEKVSARLEAQFNANELKVEEKRSQRNERLGALKELFGHMTGTAGDLRARFQASITTSQFPAREQFLTTLIEKMTHDTELPTVEEIEQLWFELHREATESGRVVKFPAKVGAQEGREVVRIGQFNLVSDGEYLAYDDNTRTVSVLPRQPEGHTGGAGDLQDADGSFIPVGVDPTGAAGGAYLKALINSPTFIERWRQGALVGYVITLLGVAGLLVAAWRYRVLSDMSRKVERQRQADKPLADNPLGRVLLTGAAHAQDDVDALELKLGEAIIKERPQIQRALPLLKVIAMVAPLLGLLGTVTGMIIVFQAITIYGAGDPKAMAGGISQALVTTVQGLIVAIPMLLAHTLLHGRARELLHVLEEQTAGLVAQRAAR